MARIERTGHARVHPTWGSRRTWVAAYAVSVVVLTIAVGYRSIVLAQDPFHLQDWVISYAAGMIRRGLAGEVVYGLSGVSGLSPSSIVWLVQSFAYIALVHGAASLALRGRRSWAVVFAAASPALLLFHLHDTSGGYRKELLGLALVAQIMARFDRTGTDDRQFRILVVGLVATPLLVLSHELNIVILPVLLSLVGEIRTSRTRWIVLGACTAAVLAAGLVSILFPGNPTQVEGICDHLRATLPPSHHLDVCGEAGAVSWLSVSASQAYEAALVHADRHADGLVVVLPLVAVGLHPLAREARLSSTARSWRWGAIGLAGAAGALAVASLVALDWGRLIYAGAMLGALQLLRLRASSSAAKPDVALTWSWIPWAVPAYAALWNLNHSNDLLGLGLLRLLVGL